MILVGIVAFIAGLLTGVYAGYNIAISDQKKIIDDVYKKKP